MEVGDFREVKKRELASGHGILDRPVVGSIERKRYVCRLCVLTPTNGIS